MRKMASYHMLAAYFQTLPHASGSCLPRKGFSFINLSFVSVRRQVVTTFTTAPLYANHFHFSRLLGWNPKRTGLIWGEVYLMFMSIC